jgi:hypothetical protein
MLDDKSEKSAADSSGSTRIREGRRMRKRTSVGLWVGLVAVAVAGYDYTVFRQLNSQLPPLSGAVNSLVRMGGRVDSVEAKLQAWTGDREALVRRMAALDRRVGSGLRLARKQSEELVARAQLRMEQELDKRAQVIEARLTRFESNQEAGEVRLAQLQQEVANVRQEIAAVRTDTERELVGLRQEQVQSQTKLETIANQIDRRRVDFEVAKNETRELTPEISLRVTHTDARYQRYQGWMWYEPDRRTLWIADQAVQQPVALRPKHGGEPCELVVTRVDRHGVVGYVLVPVPAVAGSDATVSTAAEEDGLARHGDS